MDSDGKDEITEEKKLAFDGIWAQSEREGEDLGHSVGAYNTAARPSH